jgi:hypothetical protein
LWGEVAGGESENRAKGGTAYRKFISECLKKNAGLSWRFPPSRSDGA